MAGTNSNLLQFILVSGASKPRFAVFCTIAGNQALEYDTLALGLKKLSSFV